MIVNELRQSILNDAIKGQLTVQNNDDYSSKELVAHLLETRKELVEKKEILKKPFLKNEDIEPPFAIPDNWSWSLLSNVSIIQEGAGIRKHQYTSSGTQLFSVTNILDGSIDLDKKKLYVNTDEFKEKYSHLKLNKGDIVTACSGGSWGKVAIYDKDDIVMLNTSTLRLRFFQDLANNKYLYYVIKSEYFKNCLANQLTGIQPNFGYAHYSTIPIPIPPIEEQERIVEKLDILMEKLDNLEALEENLKTSFSDFPLDMKKSILISALKGEFTSQNEKETVDISSIKEELISVEQPFAIPDNWKWISHNNLFDIVGGSQPAKTHFSKEKKENYVQLYQTRDYGKNPQPIFVDKNLVSKFTKKGDILLARYGGSLGKVFWANDGAYNVALVKVVIKYPELINNKYLFYYYLSDIYQSKVKGGNRSAQAGFSKDDLASMPFPLPPIEDQERIVEKLDEILPLCDGTLNIINVFIGKKESDDSED